MNTCCVKKVGESIPWIKVMSTNISMENMCFFSWSIMLIKYSINIHIYNWVGSRPNQKTSSLVGAWKGNPRWKEPGSKLSCWMDYATMQPIIKWFIYVMGLLAYGLKLLVMLYTPQSMITTPSRWRSKTLLISEYTWPLQKRKPHSFERETCTDIDHPEV